ncbi:hypothetical protein J6590_066150 [Homalodisca vitripennis]|nr:hypothetical protein J6590_066150 [Homalodisca vitripennis]
MSQDDLPTSLSSLLSTLHFQFSVECERVVSPYIHRPWGLQAGGPMLLGVERDSHLFLSRDSLLYHAAVLAVAVACCGIDCVGCQGHWYHFIVSPTRRYVTSDR